MKILTAEQCRVADTYTIQHEPIASIDLMVRAGTACFNYLVSHLEKADCIGVVCGVGNNGGDGLVIARLLAEKGVQVEVIIAQFSNNGTKDFVTNLHRLNGIKSVQIDFITDAGYDFSKYSLIIDALFGSGLSRPIEGWLKDLVKQMNTVKARMVSIDVPSGLFRMDNSLNDFDAIVKADLVLALQTPAMSLLLPENGSFAKEITIVPIGLHQTILNELESDYFYLSKEEIVTRWRGRGKFSHKGTYGHSLLAVGSFGKMGAGVLSVRAALKIGAGLVSAFIPKCGIEIMQTAVPEAMVISSELEEELYAKNIDGDYTIGIGPGIGVSENTTEALKDVLMRTELPMVIDADALNIISKHRSLLPYIPENSVLTPHPKELQRLIGEWTNDFEKIEKMRAFSNEYQVVVLCKGAHTAIVSPDGKVYFNSTGNSGMATGGSGDVLTGMITGLIAQGYKPDNAALIGVYLHGLSGDIAVRAQPKESLIASDIVDNMGSAIVELLK